MSGWRDRTLLDLLTEHGLELSHEHEFPNDGWSGARFASLTHPSGQRFVLKRTSLAIDWIARATDDAALREAWLAATGVTRARQGSPLPIAYLGAAADGDGAAILMPDLSDELIAWERPGHDPAVDEATLGRVLQGMATLHATPWSHELGAADPDAPWCPLRERLLLLSPPQAAAYADAGNPVGDRFLGGWAAFDRLAPPSAGTLIHGLAAEPGPLLEALGRLPAVGLHGDVKLANVALLSGDRVAFIDWQMTLRAPVAVELGWFLVSNSASLPVGPEVVLEAYRRALEWDSGRWGWGPGRHDFEGLAGDWAAQTDLTWIVGLLLRGWRKGLDAEGGVVLPSGVTATADLAWWCQRAVEAADRRL